MLKVETGEENGEESDRIAVTVGKQFTKRSGTKYTIEPKTQKHFSASAEFRIPESAYRGIPGVLSHQNR